MNIQDLMILENSEINCVLKLQEVDAGFVNPFLVAAHETLLSLVGSPAQKWELILTEKEQFTDDVAIEMKVEGGLQGMVLICMDEETAKRFVSSTLHGIKVESLDEMAQNSLEEFSIRATEKAKRQLLKLGHMVNVRTRMFTNEPVKLPRIFPFLTVILTTRCGEIRVFFNLIRTPT